MCLVMPVLSQRGTPNGRELAIRGALLGDELDHKQSALQPAGLAAALVRVGLAGVCFHHQSSRHPYSPAEQRVQERPLPVGYA